MRTLLAIAISCGTACWTGASSSPIVAQPLEQKPQTRMVLAGHEVRGPGEAPAIELQEALAAARAYADKHELKFERGEYLQGAVFDSTARAWVFDWQIPVKNGMMVKGGITIITVHESGEITINYGE